MKVELISLDELFKLLVESNLTTDELSWLRGITSIATINNVQYWDREAVLTVIRCAKG